MGDRRGREAAYERAARNVTHGLSFARPSGAVNLRARGRLLRCEAVLHDPPSPLTVFRRIIGGAVVLATIAVLVELLATGDLEWQLVTLAVALWTLWGAGAEAYDRLLEPFGRFLWGQLHGRQITLDDEIADLQQRLADENLPPDREILAGVRLAEIYRRYRADLPRAVELLDRLLLKYPDSRELRVARGLRVDA